MLLGVLLLPITPVNDDDIEILPAREIENLESNGLWEGGKGGAL